MNIDYFHLYFNFYDCPYCLLSICWNNCIACLLCVCVCRHNSKYQYPILLFIQFEYFMIIWRFLSFCYNKKSVTWFCVAFDWCRPSFSWFDEVARIQQSTVWHVCNPSHDKTHTERRCWAATYSNVLSMARKRFSKSVVANISTWKTYTHTHSYKIV